MARCKGTKAEVSPRSSGGVRWLGLSLAGSALAAGGVYLSHYAYVHDSSPASSPTLAAGAGLLIGFCVLTAAAIGGIRSLIIDPGNRLWRAGAVIIALGVDLVLLGLAILGAGW